MARERGGFCRPRGPQPTRHLLLGNVGPTPDAAALADLLAPFNGGHPPHITLPGGALGRTHCFASLSSPEAAAAAKAALHCACCASLGGRPLSLSFAEQRDDAPSDGASASDAPVVAVRTAAECGIPGLALLPGFVSAAEEAALLAEADAASHWQPLARRRVLHFGHVFDYEASGGVVGWYTGRAGAPQPAPQGVSASQRQSCPLASCRSLLLNIVRNLSSPHSPAISANACMQTRGVGEPLHSIPPAARALADRIQGLPAAPAIDQLTVNEYAPGVGISPHVGERAAWPGHASSPGAGCPVCCAALPHCSMWRIAGCSPFETRSPVSHPCSACPPPCPCRLCRDALCLHWRHCGAELGWHSGHVFPSRGPHTTRPLPAAALPADHGRCVPVCLGGWLGRGSVESHSGFRHRRPVAARPLCLLHPFERACLASAARVAAPLHLAPVCLPLALKP